MKRGKIMETIYHPVSGEKGYFCSEVEIDIIKGVITQNMSDNESNRTSAMSRGEAVE